MKPLYCYKYNSETQTITEICIEHYTVRVNEHTGCHTYGWNSPKVNKSYTHESVTDYKLDRYVNGKVYTFEHDLHYAASIIHESMVTRLNEAREAALRWEYDCEMFRKKFPEFAPKK